jgi:peroxiredoxin Q/BCP
MVHSIKKSYTGFPSLEFLIDPEGTIVTVWRNVSPKGHANEVKAVLLEKKK